MRCPACQEDGLSFWRIWLFNLRQRVLCSACLRLFKVETPGVVAGGTIFMLIASTAAYFLPIPGSGRGLGFVLMLFTLVTNFVLTHHFVELHELEDSDLE